MNPRIRDIAVIAFASGMLLMLAASTYATQPECTGDRHYDGVGCCPNQPEPVECPEPEVCEPVLPCPDPAPCQPVTCEATCEDGEDGKASPPVLVYVDRCPEPEVYERCKVRRNGKVVCYRAKTGNKPGPRSIWVPQSRMGDVADKQRGY